MERVPRFLFHHLHDELCPKSSRVPLATLTVHNLLYQLTSGVLLSFATGALNDDAAWLPAVAGTKRQLFFRVISTDTLYKAHRNHPLPLLSPRPATPRDKTHLEVVCYFIGLALP